MGPRRCNGPNRIRTGNLRLLRACVYAHAVGHARRRPAHPEPVPAFPLDIFLSIGGSPARASRMSAFFSPPRVLRSGGKESNLPPEPDEARASPFVGSCHWAQAGEPPIV